MMEEGRRESWQSRRTEMIGAKEWKDVNDWNFLNNMLEGGITWIMKWNISSRKGGEGSERGGGQFCVVCVDVPSLYQGRTRVWRLVVLRVSSSAILFLFFFRAAKRTKTRRESRQQQHQHTQKIRACRVPWHCQKLTCIVSPVVSPSSFAPSSSSTSSPCSFCLFVHLVVGVGKGGAVSEEGRKEKCEGSMRISIWLLSGAFPLGIFLWPSGRRREANVVSQKTHTRVHTVRHTHQEALKTRQAQMNQSSRVTSSTMDDGQWGREMKEKGAGRK